VWGFALQDGRAVFGIEDPDQRRGMILAEEEYDASSLFRLSAGICPDERGPEKRHRYFLLRGDACISPRNSAEGRRNKAAARSQHSGAGDDVNGAVKALDAPPLDARGLGALWLHSMRQSHGSVTEEYP